MKGTTTLHCTHCTAQINLLQLIESCYKETLSDEFGHHMWSEWNAVDVSLPEEPASVLERFPAQQSREVVRCLVTSLADGTANLLTEEEVAWSLEVLGWM